MSGGVSGCEGGEGWVATGAGVERGWGGGAVDVKERGDLGGRGSGSGCAWGCGRGGGRVGGQ